jgi:hypothetical protein
MLAQVAGMVETVGLQIRQIRACGGNFRQRGFRQDVGGDELDRRIGDLVIKLMFRYSPDATREITSRRVISGSTMASRPRRP